MSNEHSSTKVESYYILNNQLNIPDINGQIDFRKDKQAVKQYFLEHVNKNTMFFHDLEEKLDYLITEGYYEEEFLKKYTMAFIKKVFKKVYSKKFRFQSFMAAVKFFKQYCLKTWDGKTYLERYEDRVAINALYMADGDKELALKLAEEIIEQRYQPATPTFSNAGKKQRGDMVSCFLMEVSDDLNSIGRVINSSLQLSKKGGGCSLNLTNIRAAGDPIKKIENQSTGVIPVMKLLEDSFSYANQLG